LYELGPVVSPAYLDTTVASRSMGEFVEETAAAVVESKRDDVDESTSPVDAVTVARRPIVRK
jgi:hypothetical protein